VTAARSVLAWALPIAAGAGIVWASHVPVGLNRPGQALVRLAWGVKPERIETCRDLTAEELAGVPQHMRRTRICEGTTAEYRLVVRDGTGVRVDRAIRGGGLRQDRRLYVFEELPLAPGAATVDVRFDRVTDADHDDDGAEERDRDEQDEEDRGSDDEAERQGAVPPRLSLVKQVEVRPGDVVLVTYDPEQRVLVAR
jgi:hypothetical protein